MATSTTEANGTNGEHSSMSTADLTDSVVNATGPKANPRLRTVIASLIGHAHDFCRENDITTEEFMAGIDMINRAGKMSDDKRNETLILFDILGIETLIDEMAHKKAEATPNAATASAVLGPFWRKNAPIHEHGESIVKGFPDADHAFLHGRVVDAATGAPIKSAELDVWHTAPNGLYENQDPDQPDMNLRGRIYTDDHGTYNFYCLRPTKYPVPSDGPGGELLQLLDRHPWRPAHIHFIVSAKGYRPLVTQLFDRTCDYVGNDVAFADKTGLCVDFVERKGDGKARFELQYDFKLVAV